MCSGQQAPTRQPVAASAEGPAGLAAGSPTLGFRRFLSCLMVPIWPKYAATDSSVTLLGRPLQRQGAQVAAGARW